MERKNRNILVVLITLVIAVAVFSSFGVDFFFRETPLITLPPVVESADPGTSKQPDPLGDDLIRVNVTPETVQKVIETLARPRSYYREVTVSYVGTNGTTRSKLWVDGEWSKADTTLPSGTVRHSIIGENMVYYWYGSNKTWLTAPGDERSADLEGAHIPTYEDVLAEDPKQITQADYVEKDGLACVYVAVEDAELESVSRYWVSVESGLLVVAERLVGGESVLTMTSTAVERPVPARTSFTLPDGTALHTVQG